MGVRVLVFDHLALFRQGIEAVVRQAPDLEIIGDVGTAQDIVSKARQYHPDVLLMDVHMPDDAGIEIIRAVKAACPQTNILILTSDGNPDTAVRAVEAGAVGYILKDIEPAHLVNAIRYAADGKSMINPQLARHLLGRVSAAHRATVREIFRVRGLSDREIDVLEHLARGMSDRELAAALLVSKATVKTHLRSIYKKLRVKKRTQAVASAVSHGLV